MNLHYKFPCFSSPYIQSRPNRSCVWILSCRHTRLFEMMCHLYFSRYRLFNKKYVHIVIPNVLHLNKDFFFYFSLTPERWMGSRVQSTVGCFPEAVFLQLSVSQVLLGLKRQFNNSFVSPTSACATGLNNSNNNNNHFFLLKWSIFSITMCASL